MITSALSQDFSLSNQGARSSPALLQTCSVMHTCETGPAFLGELFVFHSIQCGELLFLNGTCIWHYDMTQMKCQLAETACCFDCCPSKSATAQKTAFISALHIPLYRHTWLADTSPNLRKCHLTLPSLERPAVAIWGLLLVCCSSEITRSGAGTQLHVGRALLISVPGEVFVWDVTTGQVKGGEGAPY